MSAKTEDQILNGIVEGTGSLQAFPVKASETIYRGVFAGIDANGYLVNLTSSNLGTVKMIVIPTEGLVNDATNGSISGDMEKGDRTILCWVEPVIEWPGCAGLSQARLGLPVYASNNYDVNVTGAGVRIGNLYSYVGSATKGYISIEGPEVCDDLRILKVALTAATDGAGGGVLSLANPEGKTLVIEDIILDIAAAATDALAAIDVGVAANGTTSADTLIDGLVLDGAKFSSASNSGGTNGKPTRKWTSSQFITATSVTGSHLSTAGFSGNAYIKYRILD